MSSYSTWSAEPTVLHLFWPCNASLFNILLFSTSWKVDNNALRVERGKPWRFNWSSPPICLILQRFSSSSSSLGTPFDHWLFSIPTEFAIGRSHTLLQRTSARACVCAWASSLSKKRIKRCNYCVGQIDAIERSWRSSKNHSSIPLNNLRGITMISICEICSRNLASFSDYCVYSSCYPKLETKPSQIKRRIYNRSGRHRANPDDFSVSPIATGHTDPAEMPARSNKKALVAPVKSRET